MELWKAYVSLTFKVISSVAEFYITKSKDLSITVEMTERNGNANSRLTKFNFNGLLLLVVKLRASPFKNFVSLTKDLW